MKRKWERPQTMVQKFEANEYVAACVTGTIQCAYPGNEKTNGWTTEFDDYNGRESGWYTDEYGLQHGVCGNSAPISFNSGDGTGFEYVNDRPDYSRVITGITGYKLEPGTYYGVTWTSQDLPDQTVYHHVGRLIITNIDNDHPNHSQKLQRIVN